MIPAGTPAGDKTQQYDDIPTPATCTVTETVDGHTSTTSVVVEGSGQTVEVPPRSHASRPTVIRYLRTPTG